MVIVVIIAIPASTVAFAAVCVVVHALIGMVSIVPVS
jgi:hypothetical protein